MISRVSGLSKALLEFSETPNNSSIFNSVVRSRRVIREYTSRTVLRETAKNNIEIYI